MKVLIADDEILTLQLLEKVIDWNSMGVEIAGMTKNGREAQLIIEDCCPEILITDIKMPEIDGLELIKWSISRNKNMKIIILSAYGEFEYAQKALEYGVIGYLLKPVDEEKLAELINKSIMEIYEERLITGSLSEEREIKPKEKEINRYIQKAIEYININYNINITLEDICDYIKVSKNYFCYLFKREMRESIWGYLTKVRVQKAQQLLKETNLKNYEISLMIGYENPSYFTKTFKKLTKLTPHEYRDIM